MGNRAVSMVAPAALSDTEPFHLSDDDYGEKASSFDRFDQIAGPTDSG